MRFAHGGSTSDGGWFMPSSDPVRLRKKPVVISGCRYGDTETGQWWDDCIAHLVAFMLDKPREQVSDDEILSVVRPMAGFDPEDGKFTISVYDRLHDSWVQVFLGQWVLRGIAGEHYPCDDEVLNSTYDKVEGS